MFSRAESYNKPGTGTTYSIGGFGQGATTDAKSSRSFIETVAAVSIDGLTTETWSIAVQFSGSSSWKTLATGLTASQLYLIPQDLLYQAIQVTISATTECTIRLGLRAQPSRNYG